MIDRFGSAFGRLLQSGFVMDICGFMCCCDVRPGTLITSACTAFIAKRGCTCDIEGHGGGWPPPTGWSVPRFLVLTSAGRWILSPIFCFSIWCRSFLDDGHGTPLLWMLARCGYFSWVSVARGYHGFGAKIKGPSHQ